MSRKKVRCSSCDRDVFNAGWTYCPYCGETIKKKPLYEIGMQDVVEKTLYGFQKHMMKKLFLMLKDGLGQDEKRRPNGFTVKISTNRGRVPANMNHSTKTAWRGTDMTVSKNRPVPKETVEPETSVLKLPNKLKIEVALPGVECIENIDVLEFENSSEIRAYNGDKLYFKIIEKPKNLNLSEKKLCDDTLFLEYTPE